mgnify:CR=1 FL=1
MSEQDKEQEFLTGGCCSRRDFLKVAGAAGVAVGLGAGVSGLLAGEASAWPGGATTTTAQQATTTTTTVGPPPDITLTEYNQLGLDLERHLYMRSYPIGIKLLKSEAEIPTGAIRPKKDNNENYAMCQVFALARRQGRTVAMFKEDHWCFEPLISYGLVPVPQSYLDGTTNRGLFKDQATGALHAQNGKRLPEGAYPGLVVGPLKNVTFEPDLLMLYVDAHQLRHLNRIVGWPAGSQLVGHFQALGSCVRSVVDPFLDGKSCLVCPDPGEYDRAGTEPHEMIMTVPSQMLAEFMEGFYQVDTKGPQFRSWALNMQPNFKQPSFYTTYFKEWGLIP